MLGPGGAAPPTAVLGLDVNGLWPFTSIQRRTQLFPGSVMPGLRSRTPLRLPSLAAAARGPGRRSGIARLSVSEPSLLTLGQDVLLEGLPGTRRSNVFQIRPPPSPSKSKPFVPPPCKNCSQTQQQNRPAYIHFSRAIQPTSRPGPARRHSHNPALSSEELRGEPRRWSSSSSQGEALSVVGKPCFLSCSQRSVGAAGAPGRAQLHVFLPSEVEGEDGDEESVDEGFMDELDNRITSLKLQKVPQTIRKES